METFASRQCPGVSCSRKVHPFENRLHLNPRIERELIGTFLMNMADQQVITARKEWYVEKEKIRQMFTLFLASLPNSGEVRLKLSVHGAWNVSK